MQLGLALTCVVLCCTLLATPTLSYRETPKQPAGSIQQQLVVSQPPAPQPATTSAAQQSSQPAAAQQAQTNSPQSTQAPTQSQAQTQTQSQTQPASFVKTDNSLPDKKDSSVISLDNEKADVIVMKNTNDMHVEQDKMQKAVGDDGGCMNCVYNDDRLALLEVFGPDTCIQLVDKLNTSPSSSAVSTTLPVASSCQSSAAAGASSAAGASAAASTLPSLPSLNAPQPQASPVLQAVANEAAKQAVAQMGDQEEGTTVIRNRNTLIHVTKDKVEGCQNCVYDNLEPNTNQ